MAPSCLGAGTLLLLFMVSHTGTGKFHVIGPEAPVIALVGEEAVLPCHLSPSMDVRNMEVRWYRNEPFGLVHLYKNFQDHMEQEMPEYQGRTEFLRNNITEGHVALKIHSIQPSDGGEYSCSFESSMYINTAQFQVLVTGSGTDPHIHIDHGQSKGLNLTCTSTRWYPKPEVQWRDHNGQHLAPAFETKTPEINGLFHVESSIMLEENSQRNVTCYIRNPVLSEEKEGHISVTDALFPRVSPWPVIVFVLVVLLVIIGIISVLLVRTRKSKGLLKVQHGILREQYDNMCVQLGKIIAEHGLNKAQRFAENIKLDRSTAHAYLFVSQDGKHVTSVPEKQDMPDNPE